MTKIAKNNINQTKRKGVEVLCIGSELLLGNILNGNAKWIAEQLASLGLEHYRQTVVGDNHKRIKELVINASHRSRILITTGGLGPTPDDITTQSIASAFDNELVERKDIWIDIQKKFQIRNLIAPESNRKQSFLPKQAIEIKNQSGTAPGMIWTPIEDFTIITLPGVTLELKSMWEDIVVTWLYKNNFIKRTIYSKLLKFYGISESALAEKMKDLIESKNPTVAPYANLGEVRLRITSRSETIEKAKELSIPIENEIINRSGVKYYGSGKDSLASVVICLLRKGQETLSLAESCSGGNLGGLITSVPGSSDVFIGGIIAYNNSIKENFLGVPSEILKRNGAVSDEVARSMAKETRRRFQTNWAIAISGLAGPGGGTLLKPVGLVHIAIAGPKDCFSKVQNFNPKQGREVIQKLSALNALDALRLILLRRSE